MTDSRVFKGYCSYLCEYCFSNESSKCLYIDHETFSENAGLVKPQWYIFKKVKVNAEYDETEASSLVKSSDIAVTWTGDDLTYNLVKLENDLFLTEGNTKDDYGQTFFSMTKVMVVIITSVLYKSKRIDKTKTAMVSNFSVVGVCPELLKIEQKRN